MRVVVHRALGALQFLAGVLLVGRGLGGRAAPLDRQARAEDLLALADHLLVAGLLLGRRRGGGRGRVGRSGRRGVGHQQRGRDQGNEHYAWLSKYRVGRTHNRNSPAAQNDTALTAGPAGAAPQAGAAQDGVGSTSRTPAMPAAVSAAISSSTVAATSAASRPRSTRF